MPDVDVLIVGAGLSGIGAAHRLQTAHPQRTYAILEARAAVGGTWDLFRFPGIRSDSDMFTLGYPFRPWTEAKAIADGDSILRYVRETAAALGIDRHIRFGRRVVAAAWSSAQQRWSVEARTEDGATEHWTCAFLYLCSGYYRYDHGYTPDLPGLPTFAGPVVHPQAWPDGPRRRGPQGGRHRQRGHGRHARARAGRARRARDDAAALAHVDDLAARHRLPRRRAPPTAARHGSATPRPGGRTSSSRRPSSRSAGTRRGVGKRMLRAGLARVLPDPAAVDTDFAPTLRPVGPAAVRRARRRLLPRDEERRGRGRDRPDRHRHAHRRHVRIRPGVARRRARHRHRAACCRRGAASR